MEVETSNATYHVDLKTKSPDDFGNKGINMYSLKKSLKVGRLCLIQDREHSTIGFGRMASPFRLFYIGGKEEYVKRGEGNKDPRTLQFGVDVRKTRNSSTGEEETLLVQGDNHSLRKDMFYAIANESFAPVNLGHYREMMAYNEGTFSPAGPSQWMEHESSGTVGINLKLEDLQQTYRICLDDLDFRTHALEVELPFGYLPPENSQTFCGGPITIGGVDKIFYKDGIQGVYALTEVINALGHLSGKLFHNGGIFNVNMNRKRMEENADLSPEYFSYGSVRDMGSFLFRIAPGKRGTVWVKPRNPSATVTIQFLPEYLRKKFPTKTKAREDFNSILSNMRRELEGFDFKCTGLEERTQDSKFLGILRSIR